MAGKSGDGYTHENLSQTLAALGPGGSATIGFEDYEQLFGAQPSEDEIEGQRAAGKFADRHDCDHEIDHAKRRVLFFKRK
ncbi:MAG: hypothetical protein WDM94_08580 [Bauldia sp.]